MQDAFLSLLTLCGSQCPWIKSSFLAWPSGPHLLSCLVTWDALTATSVKTGHGLFLWDSHLWIFPMFSPLLGLLPFFPGLSTHIFLLCAPKIKYHFLHKLSLHLCAGRNWACPKAQWHFIITRCLRTLNRSLWCCTLLDLCKSLIKGYLINEWIRIVKVGLDQKE